MRQQIDCAILSLAAHEQWMSMVLEQASSALSRVSIHKLDWEQVALLTASADELMPDGNVHLPTTCLAQAAVALRRYDVCIVPVSPSTLAWTRLTLASIPRGPFTPLFGIFNGLKSAGMQDLLDLGFADFIRLPLCSDEFRARLLTVSARMPRATTLREPDSLAYGINHASRAPRPISRQITGYCALAKVVKAQGNKHESFRNAKSLVVSEFERYYISKALNKHKGNIAMAARASDKHRRAFWALMRKHQINAEDFRPDHTQE